jgi:preprotein translocase YajC subunit
MASWNARIWTRLCLCAFVALVPLQSSMAVQSSAALAVLAGSQDGVEVGSSESLPVVDVRGGESGSVVGLPKPKPTFFEEILGNPLLVASIMFAVLYLGVLLPAQRSTKRAQREQEEQLANLKKNDRVVTSFGVHGVVVNTQPDAKTVTIRIDESSNAKLTLNRDTIRVVKKD